MKHTLLSKTREGKVDWEPYHSGFQDEIYYKPDLHASVGDFHLRIDKTGRLEVTKDRVVYTFDVGKKMYEAAREASSLDLPPPEKINDELTKALK